MNTATITDDLELSAELEKQTRAALALAGMLEGDALDKAGALLTAALVLIERGAGADPVAAADAFDMLTRPTLGAWRAKRERCAHE